MKIRGEDVVDATVPMQFTISPDDVKRGKTKKADACAAAVACKRQPNVTEAQVYLSRVYLRVKGKGRGGKAKWIRYMTPRSLRSELIVFDRKGEFAPGEYKLGPVQNVVRFGVKRKRWDKSKGTRHGKSSPRSRPHKVSDVRQSPFDPARNRKAA